MTRDARADATRLVLAFIALLCWDASGLDLAITRLFGDASGFAWRDHWLVGTVLHGGAKWPAWAVCIALTVNVRRPLPFARPVAPTMRWWWLATTLACVALVPLLKRASLTSCPWSLAEFGGSARYVSHWAWGATDGGAGGCFPAGHATAAFCFLPGYFALRDVARRAARTWLVVVLSAAVVLAGVQVMRGAHYASHSLWTGWFCWAFTLTSLHGLRAAPRAMERVGRRRAIGPPRDA